MQNFGAEYSHGYIGSKDETGDKVKMAIWGSKPRSAMKRRVAATDDGGVKVANPCNR
ncbi:hypothetical protein Hanom_Chr10g00908731 [Helianthus anomalus]